MEKLMIVALVAFFIIMRWKITRGSDEESIKLYVQSIGGKFLSANYSPLGPAWIFERNHRSYIVKFVDKAGSEHSAYCKTSMWAGVHFSEDQIVKYANRADSPANPESQSST